MPRLSRRVVRNHDIPRLNSRAAIIRIQRDNGLASPRPGFPGGSRKGASAVMAHLSDLPWSREPVRLPGPVRAAQGRLRTVGPVRGPACAAAGVIGGLAAAAPVLAPGGVSRRRGRPAAWPGRPAGMGHVRRRRSGPDTLVCVGPRAFRPLGAGPFGGTRAIGSAGERLVHTEEVTGSIPVSPTGSSARRTAGRRPRAAPGAQR